MVDQIQGKPLPGRQIEPQGMWNALGAQIWKLVGLASGCRLQSGWIYEEVHQGNLGGIGRDSVNRGGFKSGFSFGIGL